MQAKIKDEKICIYAGDDFGLGVADEPAEFRAPTESRATEVRRWFVTGAKLSRYDNQVNRECAETTSAIGGPLGTGCDSYST